MVRGRMSRISIDTPDGEDKFKPLNLGFSGLWCLGLAVQTLRFRVR